MKLCLPFEIGNQISRNLLSEIKVDLIPKFPWIKLGNFHFELPYHDKLVTSHSDNLVTSHSGSSEQGGISTDWRDEIPNDYNTLDH